MARTRDALAKRFANQHLAMETRSLDEQLEARRGTMSLTELAAFLGISYDTVYRWARGGQLPATKINGTFWIDPKLVARWWRERTTGTRISR